MATTIRELLVRLGVDADTKKVANFDKALATTKGTLLKVAAAATVAAASIVGLAFATARQGDEAAKAAKRIGVNVEELQELTFAANLAGADMASLEVAFRRQAVAARDAVKTGTSPAALAYHKIGVSVKGANGQFKSQIQLFEESADGLRKLKTDTERMAVANDLFGRGGARLLPLLNEGAEGIRKMRQQARELGFVMDKEATKASEDFIDRMTEAGAVLKGVRNQIGLALIPVFTRFVERIRDWFLQNRQVIKQRIDKVIDRITNAVDFLEEAFEKVNKRVEGIGGWGVVFDQVRKAVTALVVSFGIAKLIKAFGVISAIIGGFWPVAIALGGPAVLVIGLAIAALLSFLLIGEDFLVFLRGGESAIGRFLASFGLEKEARAAILDELAQLKRFVLAARDAFLLLVEVFGPTDEELAAINKKLSDLGEFLNGIIKTGLEAVIANIKGATKDIDKLATALENPKSILLSIIDTLDDLLKKVAKFKTTNLGGFLSSGIKHPLTGGSALRGAPLRSINAGNEALGRLSSGLSGLVARGRAGLARVGPSTSTTTVGDTTITINAGAADAGEVARRVSEEQAGVRRKAYAAAQGGER